MSEWMHVNAATIQALDTAPLAFARWGSVTSGGEESNWHVERNKAFHIDSSRIMLSSNNNFGPSHYCVRGYLASLRCSLAGLTLNIDMSVSAFLQGGDLKELLWRFFRYNSVDDMIKSNPRGLDPNRLRDFVKIYKNAKCKTTHLKQSKKFREFGPPASKSQ